MKIEIGKTYRCDIEGRWFYIQINELWTEYEPAEKCSQGYLGQVVDKGTFYENHSSWKPKNAETLVFADKLSEIQVNPMDKRTATLVKYWLVAAATEMITNGVHIATPDPINDLYEVARKVLKNG